MFHYLAIIILIILGLAGPSNYAVIHYLAQKPLGHQTMLDQIYKDFFTTNLVSTCLTGSG